jgi:glycosyltransferase involved in cell wall biosynthesis
MNQRPDIRLVVASLHQGGTERVCLRLANQWASEGLLVELLLVRRVGAYLPLVNSSVRVLSPDATRTLWSLPWLWSRLRLWADVPALLFGPDFGIGLGAMKRLGILKTPLIYREGSLPLYNIPANQLWKYGSCIRGVDAVIAQSTAALRSLEGLGLRNIPGTVIWNPVTAPAAESLPPRPGTNRFAVVGRLMREKGILRLVEAFPEVLRRWPDSTLEIIGEGPLAGEIRSTVESHGLQDVVKMPGSVTDLDDLYRRIDFLVVASHYEGQPNVLLEALLYGCAAVAAGGEGVQELMTGIGLPDCLIGSGNFAAQLVLAVERAKQVPASTWNQARVSLRSRTDLKTISSAYYRACTEAAGRCVRPRGVMNA